MNDVTEAQNAEMDVFDCGDIKSDDVSDSYRRLRLSLRQCFVGIPGTSAVAPARLLSFMLIIRRPDKILGAGRGDRLKSQGDRWCHPRSAFYGMRCVKTLI